jgi:hypothetical protein
MPRFIALFLAVGQMRRCLDKNRLRGGVFDDIHERLTREALRTQALVPGTGEHPAVRETGTTTELAAGLSCTLVRWDGVQGGEAELKMLVEDRLDWKATGVLTAGGKNPFEDRRALDAIGHANEAVVIVAEAAESPTTALKDFVRSLRKLLGVEQSIVVGLAHGDGDPPNLRKKDFRKWQRGVADLQDPRLRVVSLEEVS